MGTSKSFSDTGHSMIPNWPDLSNSITRNTGGGSIPQSNKQKILSNYVSTLGGAAVGGRGGSKVGGRSSIKTAKNIGAFFGNFIASGNNLRETLSSTGLAELGNKSVSDVVNHLIEYCSGAASTIDDKAAKEASKDLFNELAESAKNIDELEENLSATFSVYTSEDLIIKYFGYYIHEHISIWFYEHLIKSKNENDANNLYAELKDFIFENLKVLHRRNPLQNIDWGSNEADRLIKNIQQDVLDIFE